MEVLEAIFTRKSIKKYKDTPVPKEMIDTIIKAGLCAPSGLNKQSPIILAVTDKKVRDELSFIIAGSDPFKRRDPFYNAACVLVVLADKSVPTYSYDGPLVMENMLLAAHGLGLGACWIHRAKETFNGEYGKSLLKKLGIEGEYEGIGNCVIGYPDIDPDKKAVKENRVYYID